MKIDTLFPNLECKRCKGTTQHSLVTSARANSGGVASYQCKVCHLEQYLPTITEERESTETAPVALVTVEAALPVAAEAHCERCAALALQIETLETRHRRAVALARSVVGL